MNESNVIEKEQHSGNYIDLLIYRLPRKNHEAMVQLNNQVTDTFKKYGILRWEIFQLSTNENMGPFVNIAKTLSVGQDEEVWVEIVSYIDRKHRDEFVTKMQNDKSMDLIFQQFTDLITPGSNVNVGGFSRLRF
jgi:uncharacterized protein YbaA (DUF1428 family)